MSLIGAPSSAQINALQAGEAVLPNDAPDIAALDFSFTSWAHQAGSVSIESQPAAGATIEARAAFVLDKLLER